MVSPYALCRPLLLWRQSVTKPWKVEPVRAARSRRTNGIRLGSLARWLLRLIRVMGVHFNCLSFLRYPASNARRLSLYRNGEVWRRLRVVFPDYIATRTKEQISYFGSRGLLRRHDYTVDIMGRTTGTNYARDSKDVQGIMIPTTRRALAPGAVVLKNLRWASRGSVASSIIFFLAVGLLSMGLPSRSIAQTPSPLQEWQYVNAVPLMRLFQPTIPETEFVLGAGGEDRPLYDGARDYRFIGGPIFDVRYRDIAFFSTGEGLGVNLVRGANLTAGVAIGYDFGRKTSDDESNLRGLPNIGRAPVIKLFANYVVSRDFPLVIRVDLRQSVGRGPDGLVGDLSTYFPLPGSSPRLIMLLGPSMTWGSEKYLQLRFGVTPSESVLSMHPEFRPTAGVSASGLGYSATFFMTSHWFVELDAAWRWLLNSAQDSPITERTSSPAAAFSVSYRW